MTLYSLRPFRCLIFVCRKCEQTLLLTVSALQQIQDMEENSHWAGQGAERGAGHADWTPSVSVDHRERIIVSLLHCLHQIMVVLHRNDNIDIMLRQERIIVQSCSGGLGGSGVNIVIPAVLCLGPSWRQ